MQRRGEDELAGCDLLGHLYWVAPYFDHLDLGEQFPRSMDPQVLLAPQMRGQPHERILVRAVPAACWPGLSSSTDEVADGDDGIDEVEDGVDDFLPAFASSSLSQAQMACG
ncbi:hypothetical protein IU500_28120 [Nocardia terpenica]|uniref:hypothetical protein n=1 Tax=Nocardia terpenica TaxID=455432 RepID=UPI001892D593|nr:hypothetical protein [Nocardia terpenica]MBF6065152.1 hypothetical protein [Nocardia terpenica]MBF6107880.1 hypothetical protein [Nocardia terpenica]MBF6115589.1 hypothetical protein [Nocardia terpenica]